MTSPITLPALPPAPVAFDYGAMNPNEAAALRAQADRICKLKRTCTSAVIEIGRELIDVKTRRLQHGQFEQWIEAECGFTRRTADNYMNAAKFAEEKPEIISDLPPTLVYQLASKNTPPEVVNDIVDRIGKGEIIEPREVAAKLHEARRQKAGYPFDLIGPNGEKPEVIADGRLWSEKKRTLYKKPNPPHVYAAEAARLATPTEPETVPDQLTDATEKVSESEPEITEPSMTTEELRAVASEAAERGLRGGGGSRPSRKNPHYVPPSKAGAAWTDLYGTARAFVEWATEENVALAIAGMFERTDDQSANVKAVVELASIASLIRRRVANAMTESNAKGEAPAIVPTVPEQPEPSADKAALDSYLRIMDLDPEKAQEVTPPTAPNNAITERLEMPAFLERQQKTTEVETATKDDPADSQARRHRPADLPRERAKGLVTD